MSKLFIEANAEVFIIPNHAGPFSTMVLKDFARPVYQKICADNNIEFDEEENLIQLWFTSEDELHSENLVRHGFSFNIDGTSYHTTPNWEYEQLPLKLVDIKEGETFDLWLKDFPCWTKDKDAEDGYIDDIPVDILLHVKANQSEYRYRNFGTYEETLRRVCF